MMDWIASTGHQEDVFWSFLKLSHYCWDSITRGWGLCACFRQLHGKHAKLVIKCVVTIFPNLFSTYSYSHTCILMSLLNPDNYVWLLSHCLGFFQFGDFLFCRLMHLCRMNAGNMRDSDFWRIWPSGLLSDYAICFTGVNIQENGNLQN